MTDYPPALRSPQISVLGEIVDATAQQLRKDLLAAEAFRGDVAVEVTTVGGDAETARRMVLDLREARARLPGRLLFLGKTTVYSAGSTLMSAFPRADRYLTEDAWLMIHCRQLDKTVEISGPIRSSLPQVEALRAQLKTGLAIEEDHFRQLIAGSDVGLEEIKTRSLHNWYLGAAEALERGLIAGIVDLTKGQNNDPPVDVRCQPLHSCPK